MSNIKLCSITPPPPASHAAHPRRGPGSCSALTLPCARRAGKDLTWYTKATKHDLASKGSMDDMAAVKARERDLMAMMLYPPSTLTPNRPGGNPGANGGFL